jgi:hypothetical protein
MVAVNTKEKRLLLRPKMVQKKNVAAWKTVTTRWIAAKTENVKKTRLAAKMENVRRVKNVAKNNNYQRARCSTFGPSFPLV